MITNLDTEKYIEYGELCRQVARAGLNGVSTDVIAKYLKASSRIKVRRFGDDFFEKKQINSKLVRELISTGMRKQLMDQRRSGSEIANDRWFFEAAVLPTKCLHQTARRYLLEVCKVFATGKGR